MSNFTEMHNKLAHYLQELYQKHKELDNDIDLLYTKYTPDQEINKLKTKKLWLKDEIHRVEAQLKELG